MALDVEAYARIMAELAASGARGRRAVLERHGLDEAAWEAIDVAWQDRLSAALDVADEGVPAVVSSYAAAYEAAQASLGAPISIEQFAQVTRLVGATADLQLALSRAGVTMADYVRAAEHYSRRLVADEDLERRFAEALRRG